MCNANVKFLDFIKIIFNVLTKERLTKNRSSDLNHGSSCEKCEELNENHFDRLRAIFASSVQYPNKINSQDEDMCKYHRA